MFELAHPILDRLGVPATVFAPTQLVDTDQPMSWPGIDTWVDGPHHDELVPMSWNQMGVLAEAGWEIGSHTQTHPHLTELPNEEIETELVDSRTDCERALGRRCRSLAYPFGDENTVVVEQARAAGYLSAAALPSPLLHRPATLRWPRIGVYRNDSMLRFRRKASPVVRRLRRSPAWKVVDARHRLRP